MKLVRFKVGAKELIGAQIDNRIIDIKSGYALYLKKVVGEENPDFLAEQRLPSDMIEFLKLGNEAIRVSRETIKYITGAVVEGKPLRGVKGEQIVYGIEEGKILAPVQKPPKILAIALNNKTYAKELELEPPKEPIVLFKAPTSIIGLDEPVIRPNGYELIIHEVEVGVVIGKMCRKVPKERAYDVIAGYTIVNDVTCRDITRKDRAAWSIGKSFDTFAPTGPCLVLKDQIMDPQNLELKLSVNKMLRQKGNTNDMIFTIPQLIEYVTSILTLEPGDLICTGSVPGSGPVYPGDLMEAEVEGIGTLRNPVIQARSIT